MVAARCLASPFAEARRLLALLPMTTEPIAAEPIANTTEDLDASKDEASQCSVLTWARWGLMALSGPSDGPPASPAEPVAQRIHGLIEAIAAVTGTHGDPVRLDPAHLLADRAALHGWPRAGSTSVNGTCRLLRASNGWLAISLSRPDDIASVPAILGRTITTETWAELALFAESQAVEDLASRAQLLGIPAAALGAEAKTAPLRITTDGEPGTPGDLVLDLSAMWAGPLCAHVLGLTGARVVKVEDVNRPDGARFGPPAFYAELHQGHENIVLDFSTASGRKELAQLADQASVVIESSRPRALRRLGLIAEDWLRQRQGRTWVSITGYGREDPQQRVAFGDDAAAAGGLTAWTPQGPVFCGDAIADPLTGLYAALAACASRESGGGHLVDVRMAGVSADISRAEPSTEVHHHPLLHSAGFWSVRHGDTVEPVRVR